MVVHFRGPAYPRGGSTSARAPELFGRALARDDPLRRHAPLLLRRASPLLPLRRTSLELLRRWWDELRRVDDLRLLGVSSFAMLENPRSKSRTKIAADCVSSMPVLPPSRPSAVSSFSGGTASRWSTTARCAGGVAGPRGDPGSDSRPVSSCTTGSAASGFSDTLDDTVVDTCVSRRVRRPCDVRRFGRLRGSAETAERSCDAVQPIRRRSWILQAREGSDADRATPGGKAAG